MATRSRRPAAKPADRGSATPWTPAPGDAVYLAYHPRELGVVVTCGLDAEADLAGLIERRMPGEGVAVAWQDGRRTVEWSSDLSSLDELIAACERKLTGHLERRARLEAATGAPPRRRRGAFLVGRTSRRPRR